MIAFDLQTNHQPDHPDDDVAILDRRRRSSCVGPLGEIIELSIFAPFLILAFLVTAFTLSVRIINIVQNINNNNNNNNNNMNTNMNTNMNMNMNGRMLEELDWWSRHQRSGSTNLSLLTTSNWLWKNLKELTFLKLY